MCKQTLVYTQGRITAGLGGIVVKIILCSAKATTSCRHLEMDKKNYKNKSNDNLTTYHYATFSWICAQQEIFVKFFREYKKAESVVGAPFSWTHHV